MLSFMSRMLMHSSPWCWEGGQGIAFGITGSVIVIAFFGGWGSLITINWLILILRSLYRVVGRPTLFESLDWAVDGGEERGKERKSEAIDFGMLSQLCAP
jgi:hypothetical protein